MSELAHHPMVLIILDGWGYSEDALGNAILAANKPNFDQLWEKYPHTLLSASGLDVGLPEGQMGNSEVGHLHIGSGRLVLQDLTKIDLEIKSGRFFTNPILVETVDSILPEHALHIFGLLSAGGVHSHNLHIEAMLELAIKRGVKNVYVHAFLDGRDTPPQSALKPIESMENKLKVLGNGKMASICGRYYGMDRDKRWDRVQDAYDLFTLGKSQYYAPTAARALELAYARGETDEFVKPTAIHRENDHPITIKDGDAIVFMNFRADRARELTYAFVDKNFNGFKRQFVPKLNSFVTLTEYAHDLNAKVAYPAEDLTNTLGQVVADNCFNQLRIAETEKYAHVTYFVNGGREQPFLNEDRILIQSPKDVATYDLKPQMSAYEVTDKLLDALRLDKYDMVICNYANPDMVGHTGNFTATVAAIEAVDICIGRIVKLIQEINGEIIITADHGNAEKKIDPVTHAPYTAHTTNLVPFIYIGRPATVLKTKGKLIDIAPTILYLMKIKQPKEMTGEVLIKLN